MITINDIPYMFDIVLSDFGRASTVELLRYLANEERARIQQFLTTKGGARSAPFFDEYRRIMFTCVGNLSYIKQDILSENLVAKTSPLDSSVLYGVRGTKISTGAVGRIVEIVGGEVEQAFTRGYRRFRLVIPCNTLALIEKDLNIALGERLTKVEVKSLHINEIEQMRKSEKPAELTIYTVPKAVLKYVKKQYTNAKLLLVGTSLAQQGYAEVLDELAMEAISIIEFTTEEQDIMDELLVASIGQNAGYVRTMKRIFREKVLSPSAKYGPTPVIIEASTDFDLDIGINSLHMFGDLLLDDVYDPLERMSLTR